MVHTGAVDVFEFDQQGSFRVPQEPFEIQPGDGFRTTCYYRDGTTFGYSSQEEMCQAYLLYYPAKQISYGVQKFPWICLYGTGTSICEEQVETTDLLTEMELGRVFGTATDECVAEEVAIASEESEELNNIIEESIQSEDIVVESMDDAESKDPVSETGTGLSSAHRSPQSGFLSGALLTFTFGFVFLS